MHKRALSGFSSPQLGQVAISSAYGDGAVDPGLAQLQPRRATMQAPVLVLLGSPGSGTRMWGRGPARVLPSEMCGVGNGRKLDAVQRGIAEIVRRTRADQGFFR
jgi:anti-sigma factor RsiW